MSYNLEQLTSLLTVSKRIQETNDSVSLVFDVTPEVRNRFHFQAGQFVTLFLDIDGGHLPRSYSISSSPLVDQELKVTVKRVIGGRGSNFIIDRIKVGDRIRVSPPSGHFFKLPKDSAPKHYILAAAGSGITPIFSIMKTVLSLPNGHRVSLIFANRSPEQIIYRRELERWEAEHSGRLKITHVFSKDPTQTPKAFHGRCEGAVLKTVISEIMSLDGASQVEAYMCGPRGFMDNIRQGLVDRSIPLGQIHEEAFTSSTHAVTTSEPKTSSSDYQLEGTSKSRVFIGKDQTMSRPEEIVALIGGEEFKVPIQPGQTVLEALIAADANPPYSCLEGACMACLAKVREGRVYQDDPGILSDENLADGETLTCQARPVTRSVRIDYDSY